MKPRKNPEEGAATVEDAKAVVGIRLEISYDDYCDLDLFSNSVKTKGMRLFKRRTGVGLANISTVLVELMLTDKDLQKRVEVLNANKSAPLNATKNAQAQS